MRHTHPNAVTLVLSGYPFLDEALSAIRLQADVVLVKTDRNRLTQETYPRETSAARSSEAAARRERGLHTGA